MFFTHLEKEMDTQTQIRTACGVHKDPVSKIGK